MPVVPEVGTGNAPSSTEVNEEVAWALLRAKLNQIRPEPSSGGLPLDVPIGELLKALGPPSLSDSESSAGVPPSVLAVAPHLARLLNAESLDAHLHKTWELCQAYSSDKAIKPLIDLMQSQPLQDPIPRSIWHKIIRDKYVNFELWLNRLKLQSQG